MLTMKFLIIVGLILYIPTHSKEINKYKEHQQFRLEEVTDAMIELNSNLNLLSITILDLLTKDAKEIIP